MFVAIDAQILPTATRTMQISFRGALISITTDEVGSDYTILKILPATAENLTQVRQLLSPTADMK